MELKATEYSDGSWGLHTRNGIIVFDFEPKTKIERALKLKNGDKVKLSLEVL